MTFISQKSVTTRKPHRCHGCLAVIPAKSPSQRETYVGDNGPYTLYWCAHCQDMLPRVDWRDFDDEGITPGELMEYFVELGAYA